MMKQLFVVLLNLRVKKKGQKIGNDQIHKRKRVKEKENKDEYIYIGLNPESV